jgi:hypothetical protein
MWAMCGESCLRHASEDEVTAGKATNAEEFNRKFGLGIEVAISMEHQPLTESTW